MTRRPIVPLLVALAGAIALAVIGALALGSDAVHARDAAMLHGFVGLDRPRVHGAVVALTHLADPLPYAAAGPQHPRDLGEGSVGIEPVKGLSDEDRVSRVVGERELLGSTGPASTTSKSATSRARAASPPAARAARAPRPSSSPTSAR